MKRKLVSVLVAGAFLPAFVQAQEAEREGSGSVSIGARVVGVSANDPSKLNEYRDVESGTQPIGAFELRRRGESSYLNAYGENLGRDDQYLDLNGGRYGTYKYRVFSDQLRHNFGSGPGARTHFNGAGTSTLTFITSPVSRNTATWNTFDHSYKRHNFGGMLELQATSPWYFRLDANEVQREGINVFAGAKGTSPGNGFTDLPAPIDYTTRNATGEIGFSSRRGHFAVSLMHSTFDNRNEVLRWANDYLGPVTLDSTMLPPSNQLSRIAFNGNLRHLPMQSTLAGRLTYGVQTSEVTMLTEMLDLTRTGTVLNQVNLTRPSGATYHGNHKTNTASLSLASHPTQALDTRVYWNYQRLKNDSTHMEFNPNADTGLRQGANDFRVNCNRGTVQAGVNPTGIANPCEPELFHYTKKNVGAEGGYRLTRTNKVSAGLDYTHTERERADFVRTNETRLFGELKNSSLDWLTGRVKYQYLVRRSSFEPHEAVLIANPTDLYMRRFDLSSAHQHLVKLAGDAALGGGFDVGLEVILKRNNYLDVPLGRQYDQRQEYYASVGWGDPSRLRLLVFGDIEYVTYESRHRVGAGGGVPPVTADPASGNNSATYNWRANNQDTSWQVGIGADWAPRTRLKVKSALLYAQTNGEADFAVEAGGSTTVNTTPIRNFDNTRRFAFTLRGTYEYSRQWDFSLGYAYERYRYSDIGFDDTRYVAGASAATVGNANAYTTGQFAFQNYSANIVYGIAKLKF